MINKSLNEIEPGQKVELREFKEKDAEHIPSLFRAVYGEGYPIRIYYEPAELLSQIEEKKIILFVIKTPREEIVACTAFYTISSNQNLYEHGLTLVLPSYRNRGINNMIFKKIYSEQGHLPPQIHTVLGEPVCNHVFMQKPLVKIGFVEMGLAVDLMPATAFTKEKSAKGRVAVLDSFKSIKPKPHAIYPPKPYQEIIKYLYDDFDDDKTFQTSHGQEPESGLKTVMDTTYFSFAGVMRNSINVIGSDFKQKAILPEKDKSQKEPLHCRQIILKLADPRVEYAIKCLGEEGYFLGGALPCWFTDSDGIMMQKINGTPEWESIILYSDKAKKICEYIHNDWESSRQKRYN